MPPYILLALIGAFFYSLSGLLNKQAMTLGCGPLRIYMIQAWCGALLLTPFLFSGPAMPVSVWWQPPLTGAIWFAGSAVYMFTLRRGDLSIIGPVAGVKPVFNAALIATLLHEHVPPSTWIACGLAAIALAVMRTPSSSGSHSFGRSAVQTLIAMLFFALTDACLQRWAAAWGPLRFACLEFICGALLSLSLIPMFGKKYRDLSRPTRRFLFAGAFCAALPGIFMSLAIGKYGHGAEVNVGYSFHVLITLFIVWMFGRYIGNTEHTVGKGPFLRRLAGAVILLAAIGLILAGRN
ncbi:MAG: EamA family transporter [Kiritimatiellales bacterium]